MTINGGIKFFDLNEADSLTGAGASATSGNSSADLVLDKNKYTVWRSVSSNDTILEQVEITLAESATFSRLFLLNHNFKEFVCEYFDGFVWVDFANVTGINGVISSSISETDYSLNTAYYEFDQVNTNKIRISVLKTQIANEEKFLNQFVITQELGTLDGFPMIKDATKDKNIRKSKLLNGRVFVQKSIETMKFNIDFKNYPPTLVGDLDLLLELFDRDDSFFVWLCGGRNGTTYFKYQLSGFRIEDLIQVQVTNVFKDKYKDNFYNGGVNMKLKLEEVS